MTEKRNVRIGVPPGVGDVYWCLCKLADFRAQHRIDRVEIVIKSSPYDRAGAWAEMCPFVDLASFEDFSSPVAEKEGLGQIMRPRRRPDGSYPLPLDLVFWPNAVVDRGDHLSTWLPKYALDQAWRIATLAPASDVELEGRPVVYASSRAINKTWAPKLGAWYWSLLLEELGKRFGKTPILIGAEWDLEFRSAIKAECIDLCGVTTLPEVAWILEHAAAVAGIISGMTILANHFRTPTIAFYPPKHHPRFPESWIPPGAPALNYRSDHAPTPANIAVQLHQFST